MSENNKPGTHQLSILSATFPLVHDSCINKNHHKLPKSLGSKQLHQLIPGLAPFSCTEKQAKEERGNIRWEAAQFLRFYSGGTN